MPISLAWEKVTPFGAFEFKHTIEKRQIAQELPPPILNEVKPEEDVPLKVPMLEKVDGKEEEKPAEVLITSVVEPLEPGKQISFLLPVDSEVVITPAVKNVAPAVPLALENPLGGEPETKPEIVPLPPGVVDITPKPVEFPPPPEVKPVEHVELSTPIESTVPPILLMPNEEPKSQIIAPEVQNVNPPVVRPVINSIPIIPFLYTNINGVPFYTPASNVIPFITPAAVPIPETALPLVPPSKEIPPVVKEEIPVIVKEKIPIVVKEVTPVVVQEEVPVVVKEEIPPVVKEEVLPPVVKEEPPPNFFVKSSRLVLYVGSMMLQMLSRLVNGQVNFNQIPLPPPIPGLQ